MAPEFHNNSIIILVVKQVYPVNAMYRHKDNMVLVIDESHKKTRMLDRITGILVKIHLTA